MNTVGTLRIMSSVGLSLGKYVYYFPGRTHARAVV